MATTVMTKKDVCSPSVIITNVKRNVENVLVGVTKILLWTPRPVCVNVKLAMPSPIVFHSVPAHVNGQEILMKTEFQFLQLMTIQSVTQPPDDPDY